MIISKTPLRISFCGGGTDIKEYYSKKQGSVVSTAVNKFVYIAVNDFFERRKIRVNYQKPEIVNDVKKIKHLIIREALKFTNISGGIEITSISDIPPSSGLGSSSAFTVGLLNALHAYLGERISNEELANEACRIEIDVLKEPIGKQDQYISAYGGFRHFLFNANETVKSEVIPIPEPAAEELQNNLMLFYTGITRKAGDILREQKRKTPQNMEVLDKMKELSLELKRSLVKKDIIGFGELLHKNWEYKKMLGSMITNPTLDRYYSIAVKSGAIGGKVLGAGGGGFLLFYVKKDNQEKVRKALQPLNEIKFSFEKEGTRIVYMD